MSDLPPKPWRIAKNRKNGRILVVDANGQQVCYLWGRDGHNGQPVAELIVAAVNNHVPVDVMEGDQ